MIHTGCQNKKTAEGFIRENKKYNWPYKSIPAYTCFSSEDICEHEAFTSHNYGNEIYDGQ